MENINKSQKILIKKSFKFTPILNNEFSTIKSSHSSKNNVMRIYNSYNNLKKKDFIISKNKITLNRGTEKKYHSRLFRSNLFKILSKKSDNTNNKIQETKKVDAFTQKSIYQKKIYRIKSNFLKNLSDNIPKKK